MKVPKTRVPNKHYSAETYDTLERFISYFLQKEKVFQLSRKMAKKPRILEVGKGTGFLTDYLKRNGFVVKTFDFDPALKPDYIGDIRSIIQIVHQKFDIITCFEVLEHLPFGQIGNVLAQLSRLTKKYLIISVPQKRLYFSFWLKLPLLAPIGKYLGLSPFLPHRFHGQHYWELGCRGYSIKRFKNLLGRNFKIVQEFTHPLASYHRFFVLKKRYEK